MEDGAALRSAARASAAVSCAAADVALRGDAAIFGARLRVSSVPIRRYSTSRPDSLPHGRDPAVVQIEAAYAEIEKRAALVRLHVRREHPGRRLRRAAADGTIVHHGARHAAHRQLARDRAADDAGADDDNVLSHGRSQNIRHGRTNTDKWIGRHRRTQNNTDRSVFVRVCLWRSTSGVSVALFEAGERGFERADAASARCHWTRIGLW